jgi:hypothetical protein
MYVDMYHKTRGYWTQSFAEMNSNKCDDDDDDEEEQQLM